MTNSTAKRSRSKPSKPKKPYKGFPLDAHASGRQAKRIRQPTYFFGCWGHKSGGQVLPVDNIEASAAEALDRFNREWTYRKDGRTPPSVEGGQGCTVLFVCIAFLASKENKLNAGELTERSFRDYYRSCHLFAELIGKYRRVDDLRPDDFERLRTKMAERFGPVTLCNEINRCRVVLKFAFDQGLIAAPVRYGRTVVRQTVGEGVAYGTPCSWSANV